MSISPQSLSEVRTLAEQSLGDHEASQHFQDALGVSPEAFTGLDEDAQRKCLQQRQSDEREGQAYYAQQLPGSIAHGDLQHVFGNGNEAAKATRCRVVIDMGNAQLIAAQEWTGQGFENVSVDRFQKLSNAVIDAYAAHDNPDLFGLQESRFLPSWVDRSVQEQLLMSVDELARAAIASGEAADKERFKAVHGVHPGARLALTSINDRGLAAMRSGDTDAMERFKQEYGQSPAAFNTAWLNGRNKELMLSLRENAVARGQGARKALLMTPEQATSAYNAITALRGVSLAHAGAEVSFEGVCEATAGDPELFTVAEFFKGGERHLRVSICSGLIPRFREEYSGLEEFAKAYGIEHCNALYAAAPSGSEKLLTDSAFAIKALREYIQAVPEEVVASLPAMPGIDGDWLSVLESDLDERNKAHKAAAAPRPAHSASPTIKMDHVFADAPGEQGAAWSRVCDEENRLASYLAQHGEGVAVVRDGDAWYLEKTQGQQLVLMHGEVLVGCVVNAVSRFQMGLDWVDMEVDDLYAYSTLVGGVADALQAGNGLLALKKDDQELFLQPLGKQDHVMKADDSLCPGM